MAQFRATIKGQRGRASRLGNAKSGIEAAVNGWQSGVTVYGDVQDGKDVFKVYMTRGSSGVGRDVLVGEVVFAAETGDLIFVPLKGGDFVAAP